METQIETTNIKERIAELRQKYARLRNLCGPNGISIETIEAYKKEIQNLETQQLKGGAKKNERNNTRS